MDPIPRTLPPTRRAAPLRLVLVLAVVAILAEGCSSGRGPNATSVLLVTFDTTRADHLSCYGAAGSVTPHIDALARRGLLFEHAATPIPVTLPAMTSLLTGLDSAHHGVRNNGTFHLPDGLPTLTAEMRRSGRRTGAIVAASVLDRRFGLNRDFDVYDDLFTPAERQGAVGRRAGEVSRLALRFLGDLAPEQTFFLWVHYYDPHALYDPPEPFRSRFPDDPYTGEIAFADDALGAVLAELDRLGRADSTLVVFTSDHGEGLGEHGEDTHGVFLYQSTLHVPLILAGPGIPRGERRSNPVSLIDVAPTLLDALGIARPRMTPLGRSLLDAPPDGPRTLYAETGYPYYNFGWAGLRAVVRGGWKYVDAPRPELYDLAADPDETADRIADHVERVEALRTVLRELDPPPFDADPLGARNRPDAEMTRRLEALGYISLPGADRAAASSEDRPDPKDMAGLLAIFDAAANDLESQRFADAVEKLETVLERNPDNVVVMFQLGEALARLERYADAEELFDRAFRRDPGFLEALVRRGVCRQLQGSFESAEADFLAAVELAPEYYLAHFHLGALHHARGALPAARRELEEAVRCNPRASSAWETLGDTLARLEDRAGAQEAYMNALASDPSRPGLIERIARLQAGAAAGSGEE